MKTPLKFIATLSAALAAGLLTQCDTQVAGSSVGTGNPSEIEVAFTGAGGPVSLTGTVDVYAATQVPVPGFQPEPLKSYPVSGRQRAVIKGSDLQALADSLWPKSSREGDSLREFNVVVKGASEGAVMFGFLYRKADASFDVPPNYKADAQAKDAAGAKASLAPLVDYSVALDSNYLPLDKDHYIFISGTGFYAKSLDHGFTLKGLPSGKYPSSFIALPRKDNLPQGGDDSVSVYNLSMPFDTEKQDTLSPTGAKEKVILPPDLRQN